MVFLKKEENCLIYNIEKLEEQLKEKLNKKYFDIEAYIEAIIYDYQINSENNKYTYQYELSKYDTKSGKTEYIEYYATITTKNYDTYIIIINFNTY